jgi:phosphoribosylformylglycinamidine (FGAM) synthase PurS component
MYLKMIVIVALPFVLAGTAHAQTAAPETSPGVTDPSANVGSDRTQQLAYDTIVEEVGTEKRVTGRVDRSRVKRNQIVEAVPADLMIGAVVHDSKGVALGTIEAVKPEGVQLLAGSLRAMVPADVFAVKNGKLMLNVAKADFEKQIAGQ